VFKEKLERFGVTQAIRVVTNVDSVVERADIINCATRSNDPVFNGELLRSGTHINGVGSYLPHMREVDLTTIEMLDKIIVDDMQGIIEEAGEFIYAAKETDWSFEHIYGELQAIEMNDDLVRETDKEITFFKSVGAAYFDLIVANGTYKKANLLGIG